MSWEATTWALKQRGLKPVCWRILLHLCDRHNPDFGCFPGQELLADDAECSISTLNVHLRELVAKGLIKRVKRRSPVTRQQESTRYYLAFEPDFDSIVGDDLRATKAGTRSNTGQMHRAGTDETGNQNPLEHPAPDTGESRLRNPETAADDTRLRNPETETDASRLRIWPKAVSDFAAEPSPDSRSHNKGLTRKITRKGTRKRAEGADRADDFERIWKIFPRNPRSSMAAAWEAFSNLDDDDVDKCIKGAERFAAYFRQEGATATRSLEERLQFTKSLSKWIATHGWIDAQTLPIKLLPAEVERALADAITVNKFRQPALFAACEQVRGRTVPLDSQGGWSFPRELVEEARRLIEKPGGDSP